MTGALGGKAAVVTGGSRGIGRAIVLRLEEGRLRRSASSAISGLLTESWRLALASAARVVAVQADQG